MIAKSYKVFADYKNVFCAFLSVCIHANKNVQCVHHIRLSNFRMFVLFYHLTNSDLERCLLRILGHRSFNLVPNAPSSSGYKSHKFYNSSAQMFDSCFRLFTLFYFIFCSPSPCFLLVRPQKCMSSTSLLVRLDSLFVYTSYIILSITFLPLPHLLKL